MYVPVDLKVFVGLGADYGYGRRLSKKQRMVFILDDYRARVETEDILFSNLHYRKDNEYPVKMPTLYPSFRRMIYAMRRERRVVFRDLIKKLKTD